MKQEICVSINMAWQVQEERKGGGSRRRQHVKDKSKRVQAGAAATAAVGLDKRRMQIIDKCAR